MKKETAIKILRAVRKDALEQEAKAIGRGESHGFDTGRAHAFRFALSLLDESGPEAQELKQKPAERKAREP